MYLRNSQLLLFWNEKSIFENVDVHPRRSLFRKFPRKKKILAISVLGLSTYYNSFQKYSNYTLLHCSLKHQIAGTFPFLRIKIGSSFIAVIIILALANRFLHPIRNHGIKKKNGCMNICVIK